MRRVCRVCINLFNLGPMLLPVRTSRRVSHPNHDLMMYNLHSFTLQQRTKHRHYPYKTSHARDGFCTKLILWRSHTRQNNTALISHLSCSWRSVKDKDKANVFLTLSGSRVARPRLRAKSFMSRRHQKRFVHMAENDLASSGENVQFGLQFASSNSTVDTTYTLLLLLVHHTQQS